MLLGEGIGLGVKSNAPQRKSFNDVIGSDAFGQASLGVQMGSSLMQSGIDGGNTNYNLKYGGQSETAVGIKAGVGSAVPIFGMANAVAGMGQSALNKGNRYNEFGYNEREDYGKMYRGLGGAFDPAGSLIKAMEGDSEGLGTRMLLGPVVGSIKQFEYEQEQALEREQEAKRMEESEWALNQFSFRPNLDV